MGISKKQREKVPKICCCGCGRIFYPFPVYIPTSKGGGLRYPEYIRGHHPNCRKAHLGKIPWNKGLKKGDHPSIERMGFQVGHKPFNDWSHVNEKLRNDPELFKKWLANKKGQTPWNKGLKKVDYPNGTASGADHGNWKGVGIIRDTAEYKSFVFDMLKRDGFTCQSCGKKRPLEVHHIQAIKDAPHLIFDPSNVVTLCRDCHAKTPNYGSKAVKY